MNTKVSNFRGSVRIVQSDKAHLLQMVQENIRQLDAGDGVPHAEVVKRTNKIIQNAARQSS